MKKIISIVLSIVLIFGVCKNSVSAYIEQKLLPDVKLYIDDVLQTFDIYGHPTEFEKDFVPLRAILEALDYSVEWKEPYIIVKKPQKRNVCMKVENGKIEYVFFRGDDYEKAVNEWNVHRVPMEYININGSIYYPVSEIGNLADGYTCYYDGKNVFIDSIEYYKEKHWIYGEIGRTVDVEAYINDIKINSPVHYNLTTDSGAMLNTFSYFVELRAVSEALGAQIEFEAPNTVKLKYKENEYIFKAGAGVENGNAVYYEDGDDDCVIVNGKTYVGFSRIRVATDGSLKQQDLNRMYVYTADFERYDIPLTLLEAYKYFDENLSDANIDFIKNATESDIASMHFGLGLWIRNNWIYPSDNRIAKAFIENGIVEADSMSWLIIEGYNAYLNGLPCEIGDLTD